MAIKKLFRMRLRGVSLGLKVSLVLTALLGLAFVILVSVLSSGFVTAALGNADMHGTHVLSVIEGGLYRAQLEGDPAAQQRAVEDVANLSPAVLALRVISTEGEIVHSNEPSEIGQVIPADSERCTACHGEGATRSVGEARLRRHFERAHEVMAVYAKPIPNRVECWSAACHAHAQGDPKLGLLEVELTLGNMSERMIDTQVKSIGLALLMLLISIVVIFLFIHRQISRPLGALREGAVKLSQLDLTHRVPVTREDEIGEIGTTFNETLAYLEELLESIRQAVVQLNAATAELFATAGEQENAATDQSSAVEETRRTMEGLVGAANEIADGAGSVLSISEQSMSASTVIGERIAKLNDQAMSITEIAETIRGIAEKSDILALNASLEGTKAGEVGRGFALVGAEMRRLAESVMEAVVQVRQLASEIRELSQSAVLASEEGQKLARETTDTSKRITLVTNQQRTATEQVRASMDELQNLATQTVRGATQSKATANDLLQTARALSAIIESAQLGGGASGDESD